jgi:acyl transferase domain-containing protein
MTTATTLLTDGDIAIIGMAGRFPGAKNLEEFWHNVRNGTTCITTLSDDQLREAGVDDGTLADPCYVKAAPLLDRADTFDAAFFGYSPREAAYIDPQQRVLLECAWEAMDDAGHSKRAHPYPVGVYAGSSLNTYMISTGLVRRLAKDFVLTLSSSDKDFLATRIAYKLNLEGPALTVQSACSTSLVAVHVACQALLGGECDLALAGGVCVKVPQHAGYFWQEGGIVSRDGTVRAFDVGATGTVFGSGAGMVVLRRLSDALADNDPIRAVIKGSAVNNDGSGKASYTAPSVDKQAEVIVEALARAGVPPDGVGYVEAHGTGTPLGDPIEFAALTKAFRIGTDQTAYCAIGSAKPNIGHLEAAAGIAGLIKAVLALEHETIPPLTNFDTPNSACPFATSPFYVSSRPKAWPRARQPRRAGVSALGVGGTNAHVVLEEAPPPQPSPPSPGAHLLPISARSLEALAEARRRLAAALEGPIADNVLADVAYTLQTGRTEFEYRDFVVADTIKAATSLLRSADRNCQRRALRRPRPTAFYAPAQLSLTAEQEDQLRGEGVFCAAVDCCSADGGATCGERNERAAVGSSRLRTFALEYGLARLWMHWGVRSVEIAGDGVGALVAACLTGRLTVDAACHAAADGSFCHSADQPGTAQWERLAQLENPIIVVLGTTADAPLLAWGPGHNTELVPLIDSLPLSEPPGGIVSHLLAGLGTLWTAGVSVDWSHLSDGERRRRVRLPAYPFQGLRHWFEEDAT